MKSDPIPKLLPASFAVLGTLRTQPRHGWSILQELRSEEARPPAVATIYAALERLEGFGCVARHSVDVVEGRARVVYRITDLGLEALRNHATALLHEASKAAHLLAAVAQ